MSEDFIERLRELGLVDITTTGWEPSEEDRQLLLDIEGHAKAADFLRTFREEKERFKADAEPFSTGEEAYRHYAAASKQAAALNAEIARLEKSADELRPWGEFSVESLRRLSEQGLRPSTPNSRALPPRSSCSPSMPRRSRSACRRSA